MRDINSDLLHTHLVMNGRRFPNYNRVYYHSNENLKELFSFVDVKDKDVLYKLNDSNKEELDSFGGIVLKKNR